MTTNLHSERQEAVLHGRKLRIALSDLGSTATIVLEGEWDLEERQAMDEAVTQVLASRPEHLVLDLTGLSFIDSTGIEGVVQLARSSERLGIRLVLIPGPPAVRGPFEICGLAERLPFIRTGPHLS